jgi:hypothetical protein
MPRSLQIQETPFNWKGPQGKTIFAVNTTHSALNILAEGGTSD